MQPLGQKMDLLDRALTKDDVPEKLHYAPAAGIVAVCVYDPLSELDVVFLRASMHLLSRYGELRATGSPDFFGFGQEFLFSRSIQCSVRCKACRYRPVQGRRAGPFKYFLPHGLCDVPIDAMCFLATGIPIAPEVDISVLLDEVELQRPHGRYVVVQGSIYMPCHEKAPAMGMQERDGRRELVVVIDQVGKVGHGLVAFVEGRLELMFIGTRRSRRVDHIDCAFPAGDKT